MNFTRTTVHPRHALITPDGYVNSVWPGWNECTVHVLISPAMGAGFCQNLIVAKAGCEMGGTTHLSQIFFYVVSGKLRGHAGTHSAELFTGHFAYVPAGTRYHFDEFEAGTTLLSFHKPYEELKSHPHPKPLFGDAGQLSGQPFMDDPSLCLQFLLPDDLSFDMAVNIFTFQPGSRLPFVETHVMEHGLYFLQGEGVYRLEANRYAVRRGDAIWMAPYCAQWFEARAGGPAQYIYYKNINRQAIPD